MKQRRRPQDDDARRIVRKAENTDKDKDKEQGYRRDAEFAEKTDGRENQRYCDGMPGSMNLNRPLQIPTLARFRFRTAWRGPHPRLRRSRGFLFWRRNRWRRLGLGRAPSVAGISAGIGSGIPGGGGLAGRRRGLEFSRRDFRRA